MGEFRNVLERASGRFPTPEMPLEGILRRRDRRRRNRRLGTGVAGIAIGLLGVLIGRSIVVSFQAPANHGPKPAPEVRNGPLVMFTFGRGLVPVDPRTGQHGHVLVGCPSSCEGGEVYDLDWSPDGSQAVIAWSCTAGCPSSDYGLYVVDVATGRETRIADGYQIQIVDWSPDGRWIAYLDPEDVVIVRPDGSRPRRIPIPVPVIQEDSLAWSPDGKQVAIGDREGSGVHLVGVDGSGPGRVIEGASFAAWSPDGTRLALRMGCTLALASADGSDPKDLLDLRDLAGSPSDERCGRQLMAAMAKVVWSPDGSRLATPVSTHAFVVVRIDGSHATVFRHRFWGALSWRPA